MQMRTLGMTKLYRVHSCLFKYQGSTISSFDLGILINRMDIETAIHAGATIPLLFGNKLNRLEAHTLIATGIPPALKKHPWLKRTYPAEKQMGLGWTLVSAALVLGIVL